MSTSEEKIEKEEVTPLDELRSEISSAKTKINDFCKNLRAEVLKSLESATQHLKQESGLLIEEFHKYEKKLIDAMEEEDEFIDAEKDWNFEIDQFDEKLKEIYSEKVPDEQEIEKIKKQINQLDEFVRYQLKMISFKNQFLKFEANEDFQKANNLGVLTMYPINGYNVSYVDKIECIRDYPYSISPLDLNGDLIYAKFTAKKHQDNVVTARFVIRRASLLSDENDKEILCGHANQILHMVAMANGDLVSCARDENTVTVWDMENETLLHTLSGHTNRVDLLATLRNNEQHVASASYDSTVKIWDALEGNFVKTLQTDALVCSMVSIPSNGLLAMAYPNDGIITLWNVDDGVLVKKLKSRSSRLAISPISGYLVSAAGQTIQIWNDHDWTLKKEMCIENIERIEHLAFLPNGHILIGFNESLDDSAMIGIFDPHKNRLVKQFKAHKQQLVSLIVLSNDCIASSASDNTMRIWKIFE